MRLLKWVLAGLLLTGLMVVGAGLLWWQQALRTPLALPPDGIVYTLPPGGHLGSALLDLQRQGLLAEPLALRLYARLNGRGDRIQAGEYRLRPGLDPVGLLNLLESGAVVQYSFTLVEGWTVAQALTALRADPVLRQTLDGVQPAQLLSELGVDDNRHAEGLLFPDTYRFTRGSSDRDLLRRAYQRMTETLAEEWPRRAIGLPYETPYEALIMASIIERETGVPAERGAIAGVFVRRLQRGMRLQTDPTIIYGLGDAYEGYLRTRHLRDSDNIYNTYRHGGLPPTPIALPGIAALRAALHPEPGSALYFVARGDGSHVFSETLAEHEAAVRRFQLQRRSDYRSSPIPQPAAQSATQPTTQAEP